MKKYDMKYMALACLMAAAVLTGGCAVQPGSRTEGGRHMTVEMAHVGDTLDPVQGGSSILLTQLGVGETLIRRNSEMDLTGELADSWKQTAPDEWTFHVKDHVKFQNGEELTGEKVKESIERAVKGNKQDRDLSDIRSVSAEGQNVIIDTVKPTGSLPAALADPAFVILNVKGAGEKLASSPVGTGPYEVTDFTKGKEIHLKGDAQYRGGKPGLDELTVKAVEDNGQRVQDLKAGRTDAVIGIDRTGWDELKKENQYQLYSEDGMEAEFLQINLKGILQNQFLRRAVSQAIQYSRLAEQAGNGSDPAGELLTPLFKKEDNPQHREQMNLTEAEGSLADAGYVRKNEEGWAVNGAGDTVDLKLGTSGATAAMDRQIQDQLKQVGIRVDLVPVPEGQKENVPDGLDMIHSSALDRSGLARLSGEPSLFMEDLLRTGASGNRGGYTNPAVDALLDQLRSESSRSRRLALMNQIQDRILQDIPDIFLIFPARTAAVSARVQNFILPPDGNYLMSKDITVQ